MSNRQPQVGDMLQLVSTTTYGNWSCANMTVKNVHEGVCVKIDEQWITIALSKMNGDRVGHKPISAYKLAEVKIDVLRRPRKPKTNPLSFQVGVAARPRKRKS